MHTGETQERQKGYFGPAVIVAARLAAAAHGGQTLVSGVTSVLLDGSDLRDLGTFRLDGVVAEQRIFQLGDAEHPPLRTEARRRGNLPRRLGRLIGRHDDLELVADALDASPVVTLVGPGGIGKTRLALAAARRFELGQAGAAWLVELVQTAASSDVPRAVAAVLDVTERPGRTLTQSVVGALESQRALLVLDSCEHVIEGAADLARAVAERCPDVRVLATSREGLGLGHEQLIAVAPLEPSGPGVELFNERASAASLTFDPHASRDDVEEICRRLDGVPLAIELAAARTTSLSPADLVARLDDRLRLLTGGRRNSVERHRTMRATIQWSYDLLTPAEQVLFQRLSIFAGPFDLTAAETVTADATLDVADVDDLLGALVERSMLVVESGPFSRRFRLLETMRQFGAEHLSAGDDTDLMAERHARWCLDRVTHIGELLAGRAEIEGVARLGELWPNLRAAVDWACATRDRRLARALVGPIVTEIYVRSQSEIGDWAERILAMTPPEDEDMIIFGLTWAARRYMRNMDRDGYERLVRRYGEPDHPMIRYARGFLYSDYGEMARWAPRAVAELRAAGDDHVADRFELAGMGMMLLLAGRFTEHDTLVTGLAERYRAEGPPTSPELGADLSRHVGGSPGQGRGGLAALRRRRQGARAPSHLDAAQPRRGEGRTPAGRPRASLRDAPRLHRRAAGARRHVHGQGRGRRVRRHDGQGRVLAGGRPHARLPRRDRRLRRLPRLALDRRRRGHDDHGHRRANRRPGISPGRYLDDRHALAYMRDTLDQLALTERTTD